MFSHVMVGSDDLDSSRRFYDATLGALGVAPATEHHGRLVYAQDRALFMVTSPLNGEPADHANGGTIGFNAGSPEVADAWHAAGLAAGGTACEDPPGVRESDGRRLYLAYLRDPAGNKLCAIHRLPRAA